MSVWTELDLPALTSSDGTGSGRNDPIKPFPFPLSPERDESLLGHFARVCAHHMVPKRKRPVTLARINTLRPETLPIIHQHRAPDLARLLDIPVEEVERRMYRSTEFEGRDTPFIQFFSTPLPASYRESRRRRVSPAALALRPYHRAMWELRPFVFDRGTMGCLVDRCQNPECGRYLGWRHPHMPELCEHCGADLRDFTAERVAEEDQEPCAFAAGLVDPDPEVRAAVRCLVPERLSDWSNTDLLDLCIRFSYLVKDEVLGGFSRRTVKANDFTGWSASDLARGARVVLGWPRSFYSLCDRLRSDQVRRTGVYGVFRDIGPLFKFRFNRANPPQVRALLDDAIRNYYGSITDIVMRGPDRRSRGEHAGFLTLRQAADRCNIHPCVLKRLFSVAELEILRAPNNMRSPVFLKADQVLAWNEERNGLEERRDVTAKTGLPEHVLVTLAKMGELRLASGPAAVMAGRGTWFRRSETEKFCQKLTSLGPLVSVRPRGCTPLAECVKGMRQVPKPWIPALAALLAGSIRVEGVLDSRTVLVSRVLVKKNSVEEMLASAAFKNPGGSTELSTITTISACEYLNVGSEMINSLLDQGLIEFVRLSNGLRRPLRASVEEFGRRFMLTGEIAHAAGVDVRSVRRFFHTRLKPYRTTKRGRAVWSREEAEALLTELASETCCRTKRRKRAH